MEHETLARIICRKFFVVWDKVFKSGLSKFCGRQSLKNLPSPLLNSLPIFSAQLAGGVL